MSEVLAFDPTRRTSAQAILDLVQLGYLNEDQKILDVTYGKGRFWRKWEPKSLMASDINPERGVWSFDYTNLPRWQDTPLFDVVVFDPPFKLNGTSAHASDEAYGVAGKYRGLDAVVMDITAGMTECARVTRPGGLVLHKTQDQVSGGHKRWLSKLGFAGLVLEDELYINGYRKQPEGRPQKHARSNVSVLQVWKKR